MKQSTKILGKNILGLIVASIVVAGLIFALGSFMTPAYAGKPPKATETPQSQNPYLPPGASEGEVQKLSSYPPQDEGDSRQWPENPSQEPLCAQSYWLLDRINVYFLNPPGGIRELWGGSACIRRDGSQVTTCKFFETTVYSEPGFEFNILFPEILDLGGTWFLESGNCKACYKIYGYWHCDWWDLQIGDPTLSVDRKYLPLVGK